MSSRSERGLYLTHSLYQGLGRLRHLLHFLVIQKSSLFFILKIWNKEINKLTSLLTASNPSAYSFKPASVDQIW